MHIQLFYTILFNPASLRIAMISTDHGEQFCIVTKRKNGTYFILFRGTTLPWYLPFCMPITVYTSMDITPCYVVSDSIGDIDPDDWVKSNGERIVPAGFSGDELTTEFFINNTTLTAVSVTKKQLEQIISSVKTPVDIGSIKAPLWDLCSLYAKHYPTFILWKIAEKGSVLSICSNGIVTKILTSWICHADLNTNLSAACKEIDTYISEFTEQNSPISLIVLSPFTEYDFSIFSFKHAIICNSLEIPSINTSEHELYAIATADNNSMNFVPFQKSLHTVNKIRIWINVINTLKILLIISVGLLTLTGLLKTVHHVIKNSTESTFQEISNKQHELQIKRVQFDSLKNALSGKIAYLQKESSVTTLLSDLQSVFPEGMWAEELGIIESSGSKWKLQIRALSESSELLNTFNNNLRKASGISNIHVLYSERTNLKSRSKPVFRVKIECDWE